MKQLTLENLDQIPFDISEAVNQLRVNLSFTGSKYKTIVVTSSIPNEGKSFIALALWKSLADIGKKVLFIDSDLRLSQIRNIYHLHTNDSFTGLAHVLSGQCDINESLYKTNITNGYMVPVTNDIANPSILLENEVFQEMIRSCAEVFDYIIIDTPPLNSVADALTVGKYADGSILVTRANYTKKEIVKESVDHLKAIGHPFLGIVLNRVDTSRKSGSYYYYGNYGNYYAPKDK